MKKLPQISKSEWEVMKVLWAQSPQSSQAIVNTIEPASGWKPNTIKTLLARLVKKGAVSVDKRTRDHLYSASISEDQCLRAETRSFLSRVYSGDPVPMVIGFLKEEKLSAQEIAELRQLLDLHEKANKK